MMTAIHNVGARSKTADVIEASLQCVSKLYTSSFDRLQLI